MILPRSLLAGAAVALALSATAVTAGPVGPVGAPAADSGESLVIQVHGNHFSCQVGFAGPHRHNRFGDRIVCGSRYRAAPPPPPRYYVPPRRSISRDDHCAVVYNQCLPLGRYSPAYMNCMRSRGC
jgi:hypothetical protein